MKLNGDNKWIKMLGLLWGISIFIFPIAFTLYYFDGVNSCSGYEHDYDHGWAPHDCNYDYAVTFFNGLMLVITIIANFLIAIMIMIGLCRYNGNIIPFSGICSLFNILAGFALLFVIRFYYFPQIIKWSMGVLTITYFLILMVMTVVVGNKFRQAAKILMRQDGVPMINRV